MPADESPTAHPPRPGAPVLAPTGIRRLLSRLRARMHSHPRLRLAYRALVAVLGAAIALLGLVLVPLPGPGWLIVFAGLGILGTEFAWAHRIASVLRGWIRRGLAWAAQRRARARARRGRPAVG